jgi:hypoxanthine phosphoribosyltransferase
VVVPQVDDVGTLLFDADTVASRVAEIGSRISRDYRGKVPLLVGVLNAAVPFLADLMRAVAIPAEFDVISVTKFSEREGIRFEKDTAQSVEGRHVILVEDSIDTGKTLDYVVRALRARKPASLAVCVLLDRKERRLADVAITYKAFDVPAVYVVGYGLDYEGRYRELPALYSRGAWPQ